jgi:hypothetical protein
LKQFCCFYFPLINRLKTRTYLHISSLKWWLYWSHFDKTIESLLFMLQRIGSTGTILAGVLTKEFTCTRWLPGLTILIAGRFFGFSLSIVSPFWRSFLSCSLRERIVMQGFKSI